MSDRIHAWLDGALRWEDLTPAERARARRLEALLDAAGEVSRVDVPELAEAVMEAVAAPEPARRGDPTDLQGPRERTLPRGRGRAGLRHRLAMVLPAAIPLPRAAALAGLSLLLGWALGAGGSPEMAVTGDDGRPAPSHAASSGPAGDAAIFVRFDVRVPEAESVDLAGSFSDWEPRYSLVPAGDGRWSAVVPLTAGVHDYVFIVDGERHLLDPAAPRAPDGFGSYNSRLALLTSGE